MWPPAGNDVKKVVSNLHFCPPSLLQPGSGGNRASPPVHYDFAQEEPVHNQEWWKHQTVNISIDWMVEKKAGHSSVVGGGLGFESGIVPM